MNNNQTKKGLRKLHYLQLSLILLMFAGGLISSLNTAFSALFGGLTAFIPGYIFSRTLFRYSGAKAAKKIVKSFYVGEALKILTSIVLFIIIFNTYNIDPLMFFVSYIAVVMTHWLAPLLLDNQQNRQESD